MTFHARARRPAILIMTALAAPALSAGAEPDAMADRQCTSPSNLSGSRTLYTGIASLQGPSVVWDGIAYVVVWDAAGDVGFTRLAADGTPLVPTTTVATTGALTPTLVFTGTEFGVAWQDTATNIRFARISSGGALVGSEVVVTSAVGTQEAPSMAWSGAQFGVAWCDFRDGDSNIFFNRLSADGIVQQPGADTRVSDTPVTTAAFHPCLAWGPGEFAVVWEDHRQGASEIYANRLSSAGVRAGADQRITFDPAGSLTPSIVWNGSNYGVAWEDTRSTGSDAYLCLLGPSLNKAESDVALSANAAGVSRPAIAWTGVEFGITWEDGTSGNIFLSRATSGGVSVGSDVQLTDEPIAAFGGQRVLAFGTLGYGLCWYNQGQARFASIGCRADATPPTCPNGLAVTGNSSAGVTLSWAVPGTDPETEMAYHRAYRDGVAIGITTGQSFTDSPRPAGSPLYSVQAVNAAARESLGCAVVTAPEPTGDCWRDLTGSQLVSAAATLAEEPSMAFSPAAYGIAWADDRTGSREIYFRRMAAAGVTVGGDQRVTNDPATSLQPSLVWTGGEFGVAFTDARDGGNEIYFARLAADGVKIGADLRVTLDAATSQRPSLVWAGVEYGVAWDDTRFTGTEIMFARISSAGAKVGSDVRITTNASSSFEATLAFTGLEYGVAWQDQRDGNAEIYLTRISAAGVEIGSDVRITADGAVSDAPALAFTGGEYGLAWRDLRSGNGEIYFTRVAASGVEIGDDVRVTTDAASSYAATLAFTGSEYALAWQDTRDGGNSEIYAATLDPLGAKLGADRRVTISISSDVAPAAAIGGRGLALAYRVDGTSDQVRFVGIGCGALDTTPPSCPSAPREVGRTEGNPGTLTLGWGPSMDPESELSHYRIVRDGIEIADTVALTYTDASFDPAAGPTYWVDAVNAHGLASGGCAAVDTADGAPPSCPTNLLATVSPGPPATATVSWLPSADALSGVRQYLFYRDNVLQATVPAVTTSYTDGPLASGTTYNFSVLAEDWAGNTSAGCSATSAVFVSTSPITLTLTKNGNGIDAHLDWNDAGLNEYVVYRSASPNTATEHARVPVSQDDDPVLQDGVTIWFYYIQQRGL